MWGKAKLPILVVMHCIVVHVQGQSHHKEWLVAGMHEEDADRAIFRGAHIDHVVRGLDAEPFVAEEEED